LRADIKCSDASSPSEVTVQFARINIVLSAGTSKPRDSN